MGNLASARRLAAMRRVLLLGLLASALAVAPAARLAAAAPCGGGAMDCCAGMGHEGAPPCHCSLKPVVPAPATMDAAYVPPVVLAQAPLPAVAAEAPVAVSRAVRVAPRSRSAPLHLLLSVLLV